MLRKLNKPLNITICISILIHAVILWPKLSASKPDQEAKIKIQQGHSSVQIQLVSQKKLIKKQATTIEPKTKEVPKTKAVEAKPDTLSDQTEPISTTPIETSSLSTQSKAKPKTIGKSLIQNETAPEPKSVKTLSKTKEAPAQEQGALAQEQAKPIREQETESEINQEEIPEFLSNGSQSSTAQILGQSSPKYPRIARKRGFQGIVTLKFIVNTEGKTEDIQLVNSSGHKSLDRAAIKHLQNAEFQPAQKNHKNIRSKQSLEIEFSLK